jgi:hypothetical protein
MQGASLFCFSQNGDVEWEFRPGRRVADKQKEFSNIYYPAAFRVFRNKDSRRTKVVVSSNHSAFYPDQVAVLGTDGKLISEYWHSGHLLWMQSLDLDGDGTDEILLSGVNDGYRQATLVVFNQDKISGASVEPGGDFHQLQGFGAGTERAVVLFPKSCLSRLEAFNRAAEIRVTETGFHVFVTESIFEAAPHYIIYEFDRNLQVRSVTLSAAYETRHKNLEAEGKLDHAFSPKEAETLKSLVRIVRKQ